MVNTSSVRPSGLKAVVTEWPATNSGRFGRPGFRLWNVAPGAACGVIEAPVGRRTGLPLTCCSLCCKLEPGLGLDGALHPAQRQANQQYDDSLCHVPPDREEVLAEDYHSRLSGGRNSCVNSLYRKCPNRAEDCAPLRRRSQ